MTTIAEQQRIEDNTSRRANWKRWGLIFPSANGPPSARTIRRGATVGIIFPHDHSRSRAYRWGEDGLSG